MTGRIVSERTRRTKITHAARASAEVLERRVMLSASDSYPLLADINASVDSSNPIALSANGNIVTFNANISPNVRHTWTTDGTAAGTHMLGTDLPDAPLLQQTSVQLPNGWTVSTDYLSGIGSGGTVFTSANGTKLQLHDLFSGQVKGFAVMGGKAYFLSGTSPYSSNSANQLWVTDGTRPGTNLVASLGLSTISYPHGLTVLGNKLIFTADDGVHGAELWISDGTNSGTHLLKDINPGPTGSNPNAGFSAVIGGDRFLVAGGFAYFAANDGAGSGNELWRTDGTAAGTTLVVDMWPSDGVPDNLPSRYAPIPQNGVPFDGKEYFTASDGAHGDRLWVTDGTPGGTHSVLTFVIPTAEDLIPDGLTVFNGSLYFASATGAADPNFPDQPALLFKTDGTAAGTVQVSNDYVTALQNQQPLLVLNGTLYYLTSPGRAIFTTTDGTSAGTKTVGHPLSANIEPDPTNLTVCGNYIYFSATSDGQHWDLCRFDGNDWSVVVPNCNPYALTDMNGKLFFGYTPSDGSTKQLWVVDNTGPHRVTGIDDPIAMSPLGLNMYVSSGSGSPLYQTDGTAAGTSAVGGALKAPPVLIRTVANRLWMFAGSPHATLWTSDGTAAGTANLGSMYYIATDGNGAPDPQHDPFFYQGPDGNIYFQATQAATGTELYRTDGTPGGTALLADFMPDTADSLPGPFMVAGGNLFVAARDPEHGREWHYVTGPPIPSISGSTKVAEGSQIVLDGSGSVEPSGSITKYEWDTNYDGSNFVARATGSTLNFDASNIDGPATRIVALRVTDASSNSAITTTTISITNVAPTATFSAGPAVNLGSPAAASFTNAVDPSPADMSAGLKYSYDFNNDGTFDVVDSSSASAIVPASYLTAPGTFTIGGRVKDKDGASTSYTSTVTVQVIYATKTVYVDAASTAAAPDGSSWQKAFKDLASAFAAVPNGGTILMAGGKYSTAFGTRVPGGVEIDGGYAGAANLANPSLRNPAENPTTIYDYGISTSMTTGSLTLDALNFTWDGVNETGGVSFDAGVLTVRNCTFTQCTGAIDVVGRASVTITGCVFTENHSAGGGAAINVYPLDFKNYGPTPVQISNCSFVRNYVDLNSFQPTPFASLIEILSPASGSLVTNCTFDGNIAGIDAGHVLSISNSQFVGNNGCIGLNGAPGTGSVTATPNLDNCTFAYNTNVFGVDPQVGYAIATNCIFQGNTKISIDPLAATSAFLAASYTDFPASLPGAGNITADPQFVRNPSPGPDGKWGTADDDYGDLHLQKTSPCIDAGDNSAVPVGTTTDIAGNPRFFDVANVADTGHGTKPIVDIGAYEAQFAPATTPASISGIVFADDNGNGTQDAGELAVSGRKFYLDKNKNGVLDAGEPTFTSGANGAFSFGQLAAGTYRLRDVLPAGWRRTSPAAGYFDVTVAAGQIATGKNFAETTRAAISGTVFADNNGNAKLDAGELGVSGRKVYIDKNKNGVLDAGEPVFTTGASGAFTFTGLAAGSYRIRDVLPTGWRRTSPTAGYFDVTVSSGQVITGKNFAETTRGLISGTVFKDANGNGVKDSTEVGLSGWVVFLDINNNGKLDAGELSFTTGSDGKFNFVIPAGTYHLREVLKSGFKRTAPSTGVYNITLSSGQSATGKNFGDK